MVDQASEANILQAFTYIEDYVLNRIIAKSQVRNGMRFGILSKLIRVKR